MINYKQIKNIDGTLNERQVIRIPDMCWIPFDPGNTDYQKYLEWIAEGNTPEPADE